MRKSPGNVGSTLNLELTQRSLLCLQKWYASSVEGATTMQTSKKKVRDLSIVSIVSIIIATILNQLDLGSLGDLFNL